MLPRMQEYQTCSTRQTEDLVFGTSFGHFNAQMTNDLKGLHNLGRMLSSFKKYQMTVEGPGLGWISPD